MKLTDQYEQAPSGLFLLNVYKNGQLIEVFEEKNLIVDLSKQIHAKLDKQLEDDRYCMDILDLSLSIQKALRSLDALVPRGGRRPVRGVTNDHLCAPWPAKGPIGIVSFRSRLHRNWFMNRLPCRRPRPSLCRPRMRAC